MNSDNRKGWSNFPKELLLRIFRMVAFEDRRLLLPLTCVCTQWSKTIKTDIFEDYEGYLTDAKIHLKFKNIVNNNVVVNNLFTCFHLAEYDEDFLFWPKASTNNMVYCSEIQGNYQVISYEITSKYIDYLKLTDSNYVEKPVDCYKTPYQQYNDVSPFSGSRTNEIEMIKNNVYPTFKKSMYTVCLYKIDSPTVNSGSLTYFSNPIRYHLNTNKRLNFATISQNNKYLVLAFSGLIQVYRLPDLNPNVSTGLNNLEPYFSKQQPSIVKYASIDNIAHVLFLKSLRLGGLSIINLVTGEELEFPHYRLDLNMTSQITDHIISLNGYQETIVYGLPKKPRQVRDKYLKGTEYFPDIEKYGDRDEDYLKSIKKLKILPEEVPIWNYFENHINASLESIIPMNNVLPTASPGCYIGLIKGYSFSGKSESIFSGSTNDRSIDLVLLVDHDYPFNLKDLEGRFLEDFSEDDIFELPTNHDLFGEIGESKNTEDIRDDSEDADGDGSFDDFYELSSQFKLIPLIYNVQYLSRSSLLSISDDGERFAILINNLLYVINVSVESVFLISKKFDQGNFSPLDLLTVFNVYTDPDDFRLELATSLSTSATLNSSINTFAYANQATNANIYMIDELLHLPEFKEQHKKFNNSNAVVNSDEDDDDDELLSDDLATSDAESLVDAGAGSRMRRHSLNAAFGTRSRVLEHKPQLTWQGNDKIAISFDGNLAILLSLEDMFAF